MAEHLIFVDGKVRVQAEKCKTCIFRPGNLMHLSPGVVDGMIENCLRDQVVIPCHTTLDQEKQAICRGFFDVYGQRIWPVRLAIGMELIEEVNMDH